MLEDDTLYLFNRKDARQERFGVGDVTQLRLSWHYPVRLRSVDVQSEAAELLYLFEGVQLLHRRLTWHAPGVILAEQKLTLHVLHKLDEGTLVRVAWERLQV